MDTTLRNLNHEHLGRASIAGQHDFSSVVNALQQVAKALLLSVERPMADVKVPFPEIHNEVVVPTPRVDIHVPPVENRVTVNPTPIDVRVEAPHVDNHVSCNPEVSLDVSRIVTALYVLSGAFVVSSVGIIATILLH